MGTDEITPPSPPLEGGGEGGAPPPSAPPQAPVADSPPTAGPAAPVVESAAGVEYDPQQVEQAMGMYRALNDPIGQGEAMTRLVQRHGQLPDWFTWDHAVDAMRNYAQFMSEMGQDEGTGFVEEPQVASPQQQTVTGQPAGPVAQDFERLLAAHVGPLQQELQQLRQDRMADEGARRAQLISDAVDGLGLDGPARDTVLNNVVYGLRAAMDQGQQVDFSPRAINQYTNDMLTHLRSLSVAEQQAQIEEHRGMAPRTVVGNGTPTGAPVPSGLAGSAARAMDMARTWEAGQPR